MNDQEAYDYYADPEHRKISGPARKRQGQGQLLTAMSSVRFAPEVIEAVRDLAFGEGVTVGCWIRRLVDRELGARPRLRAGAERPEGIIAGAGRRGEPCDLPSSLRLKPRSFSCPHLSVGNAVSVTCETCGPLEGAA